MKKSCWRSRLQFGGYREISPAADDQYKTYYYAYGDVIFRLNYNGDNFDEQMAALANALP